ncbi:secretin N-terminal domain-containing protein [Maioricimonas rarisocia]|uniref:secretin N-terminal domain-containing protein n=1 Tax=Maioricimonas rarisocia TaxID=2528026 RepID=UPI0018D21340|nr:secretin N-terminal domain-containing protein [Maioricimonas rarisocia]
MDRHPLVTPESASDRATLKFSFQNAPWPEVLAWFAELSGLTLDLTDTPPGEFNYVDDRPHTLPEALDVLNGYLLPRGFVLIRRDRFLAVLSTKNPILPNLIPTVPASRLDEYGDNELLRVTVSVTGLEPQDVAEQLGKLLGAHGEAIPVDASQSVVLQGFCKSLRSTVELLSAAVVPPADDELVFRSFTLEHIPAIDAERQIQNLFGLGSNPFRSSMARREAYSRRGRDRDDDDEDRRSGPTPLVQNLALNMKVSAMRTSNSLLVTATPAAIELIENILETIDTPPPGGTAAVFTDTRPVLRVYTVEDADEDDVAETIDAVMPGVVINEDGRHDSVHIYATPQEHREVEELIRVIDRGGSGGVDVVRLSRNDPFMMRDLLVSLFENEDRDDRPVITAEPRSASLVIRATTSQMEEIRSTLAAYGETSTASRQATTRSRFRNLRLHGGYDPTRIARMVRELLEDDRQFGNPIRVVVPSDEAEDGIEDRTDAVRRYPVNEVDGTEIRSSSGSSPQIHDSQDGCVDPVAAVTEDHTVSVVRTSGSRDQRLSAEPPRDDDRAPRVTIEVRGNELFVYSSDGVALDQVEETIRELVRQMPSRTEWTVFYLRAAAAQEAAMSLAELLQSDAYPNALIGREWEELGSDLGTQAMRIVPDARTNALFVSGPEQQVALASRFLKFLDTTELPESLRDRVPRAIPVRYANVDAVAEMIRELYKDFLEDPSARRREARRDDRDRDEREVRVSETASQPPGLRPPGIRLTLAVDAETSELLVSCNEQLFEQIRTLVEERDQAALASRPDVQVVQVNELRAAQLRTVLDGLSPQIRVDSSSTTPESPRRESPRGRSERSNGRDRD